MRQALSEPPSRCNSTSMHTGQKHRQRQRQLDSHEASKPINSMAIASTATGGTVWPTATRVSTSGLNSRPAPR